MPMTRVQLSVELADDAKSGLLADISAQVASGLGKPESYMMVVVETGVAISMAASADPAALVEVRSVGTIDDGQAKSLSATLCGLINDRAGVQPGRIYVNFAGVPGAMWGYDGRTFG